MLVKNDFAGCEFKLLAAGKLSEMLAQEYYSAPMKDRIKHLMAITLTGIRAAARATPREIADA